ncbi:MAG TPA: Na+/H+ antiporter NhaA, partial [Anaeromyxobacteraceae bacterium]|nr:Na+/H+ antiporter NhaA [Anaeromyxobacteraceae bacterium]
MQTHPPPKPVPLFAAVVQPIQAFFRLEAASGILLLACAVAALAWVNLFGEESYRTVFEAPLAVGVGDAVARFTLHALVNDGLMTIFFFVVGMEIKRELVAGELRTRAQAMLPLVAALGGMIVPAAIYAAINAGGPGLGGWGIPMATDIAFAIGVLTLLRSRVPYALVVFLTALAIFDDIGGILVIALFYGSGIDPRWLGFSAAVVVLLGVMHRRYVRSWVAWAIAGVLLWYGLHHAGIHATIAGVVLGFAIPARPLRPLPDVLRGLADHADELVRTCGDEALDAAAVLAIEERLEDLEAPLSRFVHALHPWSSYVVMPIFALANSGVALGGEAGGAGLTGAVGAGVALALVLGKPAGIFGFTWAAVKLGLGSIPGGA